MGWFKAPRVVHEQRMSLLAMLGLIWAGMHVAVVLALVSFVGVWLIRGDMDVAANLL